MEGHANILVHQCLYYVDRRAAGLVRPPLEAMINALKLEEVQYLYFMCS